MQLQFGIAHAAGPFDSSSAPIAKCIHWTFRAEYSDAPDALEDPVTRNL